MSTSRRMFRVVALSIYYFGSGSIDSLEQHYQEEKGKDVTIFHCPSMSKTITGYESEYRNMRYNMALRKYMNSKVPGSVILACGDGVSRSMAMAYRLLLEELDPPISSAQITERLRMSPVSGISSTKFKGPTLSKERSQS